MKYEKGDFYQIPRGTEKIVGNIYEFIVLARLLDRANDVTGASFPSYRDLTMGFMCRNRAIQSVKAIEKLGIITIEKTPFKANTYTIDKKKLVDLIKTSAPHQLVQDNDQSTTKTSQVSNVALQVTEQLGSALHALPNSPDALGGAAHAPPGAPHGIHDMHPNETHSNETHERKPVTTTINKTQELSSAAEKDLTSLIITDYQRRMGMVSPQLVNNIRDAVNLYGPDMVLEAVDKAVAEEKTKWSAVKTTLMRWRETYHRTPKGYCSCLSAAAT